MPEVEIIIGGFAHRVLCQAGQESRVQAMGDQVATLVSQLAETNPGHSPTRLLMLAALQFADKADELERQQTHAILQGGPSQDQAGSEALPRPDDENASPEAQATARAQDKVLQATQLYLAEVFEEMASRLEGMERDLAKVEGRLPSDDQASNRNDRTSG